MKENIVSIMNELKVGQMLLSEKNEEWIFIESRTKKAVIKNKSNGKHYLVTGRVEVLNEIDLDTVNELEEKAINDYIQFRKVQKMEAGQLFIGSDDQEYIYQKFNRTRFVFEDLQGNSFTGKPQFVKNILEKKVDKK